MDTKINLKLILEKHKKYSNNEKGGERADLSDANLSDANLWNADLRKADLSDADLRKADLSDANLWNAYLWRANLRKADLSDADLRNATGNLRQVRSLHIEPHIIVYTDNRFWFGCIAGVIGKWEEFEATLDKPELKQWDKHKAFIKSVIKKYPAEPPGKE